ncbi:MAG: alpha/beta hydrolase [Phaeodactylibacter sp.]|nr:alpha/beta hydrolase [Phaeodactylibacter sp.]MCB9294507.1 alpha/beta hydrolase [Lewinellaceae bacterium]
MEKNASSHPSALPVEGVEVTHRWLDIGGCRIHVAEAGAGEPLLMYHGWPQHWWMWRRQIPFFARYFRVIAPDMRGFGWSEATEKGYLKDELADDLARLIHALGYQEVRLLSHDWGGWAGYIASAKYPGLISQHFATNIPPIWPKLSLKMIPATLRFGYMVRISIPYFGPRMLQKSERFVHHLLTRGNTHPSGWSQFEKEAFSAQFRDEKRARASARLYGWFLLREFIPLGLFGKYHKYRCATPTRLLFGEKDFAIALSWVRGYEKYMDDFQVEFVPNAGHFIVDEQPGLVNDRALKFFTGKMEDGGKKIEKTSGITN